MKYLTGKVLAWRGFSLLLWVGCLIFIHCRQTANTIPNELPAGNISVTESPLQNLQLNNPQIPSYVFETLLYIRTNNKAPDKFVGGRKFFNREKRLPQVDLNNTKINYREWDVHPHVKGVNRGAERLVTSPDSAYYTKDHYKTFTLINE